MRTGDGVFYSCDFDVVLVFGLTELKAMVAWKENVGLLLIFLPPFLLQNVVGRVSNTAV